MSPRNPAIRAATVNDAEAIGELARQFAAYLRGLGDPTDFHFDADTYRRDGFGAAPAFAGIVAEVDGQVKGYLLYHFGYDTDRAMRLLHIVDLYVRDDARRHGVGRALMHAAARICRKAEGRELFWSVYVGNTLATEFYARLGARQTQDLRFMCWPAPDS